MAGDEFPLFGDYSVRHLSDDEFDPLFQKHRDTVFEDTFGYHPLDAIPAEEAAALEPLRERLGTPYTLNLGIYHQGEFVGWSFGRQDGVDRYHMINTGLFVPHRGKGVYTHLLPYILETVRREGFQLVYSRHVATNNPVIIPKLKAGFVITGLELNDMFGLLVRLSYYFNPLRRKSVGFRAGQLRPDDELRRLFDL